MIGDTAYPVRIPLTRFKSKNFSISQLFVGILIVMLMNGCLIGERRFLCCYSRANVKIIYRISLENAM